MRYKPRWLQLTANHTRTLTLTLTLTDILHKNQASDTRRCLSFKSKRRKLFETCS